MTTMKPGAELSSAPERANEADAQAEVQRRAVRLCVGAEPHADPSDEAGAVPCGRHIRMALGQLSLVCERQQELAD